MKLFLKAKLITAVLLSSTAAFASNVGVDINVHVGDQPRPVVVREPVYQPPPQEVVVTGDIEFILPGALGFYVAVGHPHDLFYLQDRYYLYRDGRWHRSRYSRGPWVIIERNNLPNELRRHKIKRIRHYRDQEYVVYKRDRDHYRGRHFRSGKDEWKEHKREEKEDRKEHKREDKAERKYEKRMEKEERKHNRGEGRHD
jgi:hypothetical protein